MKEAGTTRLIIEPGACGFTTTVVVEQAGRRKVRVRVESACEAVATLGETVSEVSLPELFGRLPDNLVYRAAGGCLKHTSCPVPSGILKACEVALGLSVPREVSFQFTTDDEGEGRSSDGSSNTGASKGSSEG